MRPTAQMRIAIIINMVAPYTKPLFARLAERDECELLVVSETPMERDRRWQPETELPFEHFLLDLWTIDLAWLAVGSGFKTRFDTYMYVPKRPLASLRRFSPNVVVAPKKPVVSYASFHYQADGWTRARRVVAKVEWHQGELYPRVGFIVTNLTRPNKRVVKFYNGRGTAEQHIKGGSLDASVRG